MHTNYFNYSVVKNSIWIAPTVIGNLPDDNEHSICFNQPASQVYFCSDPKPIKHMISFKSDTLSEYVSLFKKNNSYKKFHRDNWVDLYSQMQHVFRKHDPASFEKLTRYLDNEKNTVTKVAKFSRLAFGADIVVYRS